MDKAAKRRLYNAVMVIAILVILTAGVMLVGSLQGWFDGGTAEMAAGTGVTSGAAGESVGIPATVDSKTGSANIERGGIAYSLKEGAALRDGDVVETLNGSSVILSFQAGKVCLDQNSEVSVTVDDAGAVSLALGNGAVFAVMDAPFQLYLSEQEAPVFVENGVFSASAPSGSAAVYVYENEAEVGGIVVPAGQAATLLSDGSAVAQGTSGITVGALKVESLSAFYLEQIRAANAERTLCFTNAELDALEEAREAQRLEAQQTQPFEGRDAEKNEAPRGESQEQDNRGSGASDGDSQHVETPAGQSQNGAAGGGSDPAVPAELHCTIEIRCDTILGNMDALVEGKDKFVPANGTILAVSSMSFSEGETVFDVLQRACSLAGIQLEYAWTPGFDSYYIEGINQLYEMDCGNESGWMYQVNGWYPNYGCSDYLLQDGDAIVWNYTCQGYGADLGAALGE